MKTNPSDASDSNYVVRDKKANKAIKSEVMGMMIK